MCIRDSSDGARITKLVSESEGKALTAEIERGRVPMTISVKPVMLEIDIPLGLVLTKTRYAKDVLSQGFHYPVSVLRSTFRALGMVFEMCIRDRHLAIWQCLMAAFPSDLHHLILTCSGGPFFERNRDELSHVSVEQALAHPTWTMGKKITIDSATLMNKAFELIEACHLYGLEPEDVGVVIHPQSIVHSLVAFNDGSYLAQLGSPDMRMPIRYALTCLLYTSHYRSILWCADAFESGGEHSGS